MLYVANGKTLLEEIKDYLSRQKRYFPCLSRLDVVKINKLPEFIFSFSIDPIKLATASFHK